jgi:deoxyribodipyrimidine photo-lyase
MWDNSDLIRSIIDSNTTLFWFRRDLRLEDNAGLSLALKESNTVLPIFIFDTEILKTLDDRLDRRLDFIYHALLILKQQLENAGSSLLVLYGNPVDLYKKINAKSVYTNTDYEPYARNRDEKVKEILTGKGIDFKTFKDHVIFEKDEVIKDNGKPYTVFTPYSNRWKTSVHKFSIKSYPIPQFIRRLKKVHALPFPELADIGFQKSGAIFPAQTVRLGLIADYHNTRNFPALPGTSRLSVHLRFGTVSIRKLAQIAVKRNAAWLNELIWRDFYHMILWHFPHVEKAFKPSYDRIQWKNDPNDFEAWCEGRTGYPIVDAGMRELNATGFMHNRVRMITASFLTKHLLIDWRWGEAYFAKKLLDFDLAANNGGWQWASGSGCDAVPYFRVFNPELQTQKFDPTRKYIKQWVPEIETSTYPKQIVDHKFARERALKVYKIALEG